jgi:hypothetical protein
VPSSASHLDDVSIGIQIGIRLGDMREDIAQRKIVVVASIICKVQLAL